MLGSAVRENSCSWYPYYSAASRALATALLLSAISSIRRVYLEASSFIIDSSSRAKQDGHRILRRDARAPTNRAAQATCATPWQHENSIKSYLPIELSCKLWLPAFNERATSTAAPESESGSRQTQHSFESEESDAGEPILCAGVDGTVADPTTTLPAAVAGVCARLASGVSTCLADRPTASAT